MMTLHEIDNFDNWKGFLVGSTNQLFLNFPKARADVVINLDLEKVEFPNEKQNNSIIKICKNHTSFEKKIVTKLLKDFEGLLEEEKS